MQYFLTLIIAAVLMVAVLGYLPVHERVPVAAGIIIAVVAAICLFGNIFQYSQTLIVSLFYRKENRN